MKPQTQTHFPPRQFRAGSEPVPNFEPVLCILTAKGSGSRKTGSTLVTTTKTL